MTAIRFAAAVVATVALLNSPVWGRDRQSTGPTTPSLTIRSVAGRDLFMFYCATCHGRDARGRGPVAAALKIPPADLTLIARRHDGAFPRGRVEQFITIGDSAVDSAHGTKEMPVWGPIFGGRDPADAMVKIRIANLVSYIESIQTK